MYIHVGHRRKVPSAACNPPRGGITKNLGIKKMTLTRPGPKAFWLRQSPICQEQMMKFSAALKRLKHRNWTPLSTAEAPEESFKTAQDPALSRIRSIPDGPCQWEVHRQNAVTDGPSSLGSSVVGTESVPGLGLTDTRVAPGYPSQT
jgi:hypothetical protein